ncbi:FUSC family protein [Janthinobacterium fluminis]|uniref:FUSC family protein n=1 Tax=Janthinobacterium fluminis TaxID=2987524 RepID=A0ABT5JXW6_9BURK|nr:FUSC family protein [Janthinobacterium fluminis]MDC8757562.1 FUSC family protein [Janthinobacterium fluminis]
MPKLLSTLYGAGPLPGLAAAARDWRASEGERWIFVAKTMLAAFAALWLAYRLGLDSPNSAMATVFILALPSSGMVLEKSFYRLLGTLVGCAGALLLIAAFAQQSVLLFLGLALWVGLCTGGAAMFRNAQSYSFVLAGYTACMIAIPAIDQPSQTFALAVTRVSEVGLGILCSAVVNDALWPRHQGAQVMRTVQARYARMMGFCHDVLERQLAPAEVELTHLQFAADIAAVESGRAAAFFEANGAPADRRWLHAFNASFMAALTTFYTLHRLLHRLRQEPATPLIALIEPLYAPLAGALQTAPTLASLDAVGAQLRAAVARAGAALEGGGATRAQRIDFDTAAELLERFTLNLRAFQQVYDGLADNKRQQLCDPLAYTPKTPPAIVFASGARAALTLLLLAAACYHLAWPYAATTMLMATIFCALASSSPRPTLMVKQILSGFLAAVPLSFVCLFFVLVRADGYPMLVLAMLPPLLLGSYLSTNPKRAGVGIGINLFVATVVTPVNLMHVDGAAFLNTTLALLLGVALAYLIFAVVLPEHTMGHKDHVAAALWREALNTCVAGPKRLKHRFDHRVRDLLNQLNAAAGPAPSEATRAVLRQGLTLLELGHSVIEMRALIASSAPSAASAALDRCVAQIAAYLRAPSHANCQAAIAALLDAGAPVRQARAGASPQRAARLQTALADMHSIYTSLLDQLPQAPGGPQHAA